MWGQLLKTALAKADPKQVEKFLAGVNSLMDQQARSVKAQEDIAAHLADLVEIGKTHNVLLEGLAKSVLIAKTKVPA